MNLLYKADTSAIFLEITKDTFAENFLLAMMRHHFGTYIHTIRVCMLAIDLGIKHNYEVQDLKTLAYGALFHDYGKLEVMPELLSEGRSIVQSEREIFKKTIRRAFDKLKGFKDKDVRKLVISYHEYYRSNIYPRTKVDRRMSLRNSLDRRKSNERLKDMAQIIAISDMFVSIVDNNKESGSKLSKMGVRKVLEEEFMGNPEYVEDVIGRV